MNSRFMKSDMQKLVSYVIYVNLKISEYKIKHEKRQNDTFAGDFGLCRYIYADSCNFVQLIHTKI